ncbi:MAG TPA: N-6 DNA methylase, partial [Halobacteriales archaeon]|nr:N-6 DNA methylase [Halobacteriales archaeon]
MTGDAADESELLAAVERAEAAIRPALAEQLRSAVEDVGAVASSLRAWTGAAGVAVDDAGDPEAAIERAAARQASVLTNHVRYRSAVGDRPPSDLRTTPVTPFDGLDAPPAVENAVDSLASKLADPPDRSTDLIGARYADALSADERRARGQFYTPPAVARLVTEWALDGEAADDGDLPRVLDPAAGTGTFPLAAYERLRERPPDADPDAVLSNLVAVDVDEVALHVAALRLSARADGRPVDAFDRRPCSFFDLEPGVDGG